MKKIIITLLLLTPFLSGCTNIDANLSINNDRAAKMEIQINTDKNINPLEVATINKNIKKFTDKSYKIKNNSTYKKIDLTATKSVKNLANEDMDLSSLGFVTKLESGKFIDVKKNFFVTSYNINMIYNLKNQQKKIEYIKDIKKIQKPGLTPEYLKYADTADLDESTGIDKQDFIDNFDKDLLDGEELQTKTIKNTKEIEVKDDYILFDNNTLKTTFSISLPFPASYNNAQRTDGSIYIWDLDNKKPTEITMQYIVYSGFSIALFFLAGILLLIYLARRIYKHDTLKRIGNNN